MDRIESARASSIESASEKLDAQPNGDLPLDVAIVILNYNTRDLLRDALRSVFASEGGLRLQVCVVDNASTDGSAEMVAREFPTAHLINNRVNRGFSAGNNVGLRWFGFGVDSALGVESAQVNANLPRYALLLNPDTRLPAHSLAAMVRFMDENAQIGMAGPRVRRVDGSLDLACRRSFPTPEVSFYRMVGLSKLFAKSRRFNAYNMAFYPEDAVHPVDSVVGAFMLLRRESIAQAGLLDEAFFMYGEDLDWAKRMKDGGWEVWYNGQVEITHVKEAASRQSSKSRIDFYEAMWIFYVKHYRGQTNWFLDKLIVAGIVVKGGMDVGRHLWEFTKDRSGSGASGQPRSTESQSKKLQSKEYQSNEAQRTQQPASKPSHPMPNARTAKQPPLHVGTDH